MHFFHRAPESALVRISDEAGQLDSKRCQPGMFCIFADPDFKGDVLGTFGDVANVGVASRRIGGFNAPTATPWPSP
ncbi:peptidase inhibitor family I36 protein [Nonomuraea sp. NPDC004186]